MLTQKRALGWLIACLLGIVVGVSMVAFGYQSGQPSDVRHGIEIVAYIAAFMILAPGFTRLNDWAGFVLVACIPVGVSAALLIWAISSGQLEIILLFLAVFVLMTRVACAAVAGPKERGSNGNHTWLSSLPGKKKVRAAPR